MKPYINSKRRIQKANRGGPILSFEEILGQLLHSFFIKTILYEEKP